MIHYYMIEYFPFENEIISEYDTIEELKQAIKNTNYFEFALKGEVLHEFDNED